MRLHDFVSIWEIVVRQLHFRNEGTESQKEIEPERVFLFYCIVPSVGVDTQIM